MQTARFMQVMLEHGGPVLSGPTGLVRSLYKPHKTPRNERFDPFAQFISLRWACVYVCGVFVCLCVCMRAPVCAAVQCFRSTARAFERWPHLGSLALGYGGSFAMGHFPQRHMTALQPY